MIIFLHILVLLLLLPFTEYIRLSVCKFCKNLVKGVWFIFYINTHIKVHLYYKFLVLYLCVCIYKQLIINEMRRIS